MPRVIPDSVFEGLKTVGQFGVSMGDASQALDLARKLGFGDAATWIGENLSEYRRCVAEGIENAKGEGVYFGSLGITIVEAPPSSVATTADRAPSVSAAPKQSDLPPKRWWEFWK